MADFNGQVRYTKLIAPPQFPLIQTLRESVAHERGQPRTRGASFPLGLSASSVPLLWGTAGRAGSALLLRPSASVCSTSARRGPVGPGDNELVCVRRVGRRPSFLSAHCLLVFSENHEKPSPFSHPTLAVLKRRATTTAVCTWRAWTGCLSCRQTDFGGSFEHCRLREDFDDF